MRSIGIIAHENEARRLVAFLKQQGIDATCDMQFDPATSQMHYTIWVHDEDQIRKAEEHFTHFLNNPADLRYEQIPVEVPGVIADAPVRTISAHLTTFFISFCIFIFVINWPEWAAVASRGEAAVEFGITPIEMSLLIDVPKPLAEIDRLVLETKEAPASQEILALANEPYWKGFYFQWLAKLEGKNPEAGDGPLFTMVRQGEVWRLFTPAILHRDFLHILFNMIWLWVLGRPVEQRIGLFRTLLLTGASGIGSNVAQYLVSGPLFLGYSGIVCALAGFIWMREKTAPWEGYPVNQSTLLFLAFFVLLFLGVQIASFLLQGFSIATFEAGIANTAHIAGALIGIILGRFSLFKARVIR